MRCLLPGAHLRTCLMLILWRTLRGPLLLLFLLAAACALLPLRSLAQYLATGSTGGGGCPETGVYHPENPFTSWPIAGGDWNHVTADYCDPAYLQQFGVIHRGIDLGYPLGTPVIAAGDAVVTRAEPLHPQRGNNVKACATNGWCALYMHLDQILVTVGQPLPVGLTLGTVGNTGNSTGPHLHFEVRDAGDSPVDPGPSLP